MGLIIRLYVIILSLLLVNPASSKNQSVFSYTDPSSCEMNKNETFSSIQLSCIKCQWNNGVKNESRTTPELRFQYGDCPCPPGYWKTGRDCKLCVNGSVSYDQSSCQICTTKNPFNITTGKCSSCHTGYIRVVRQLNGVLTNQTECIKCGDGFTPSSTSGEECIPCHPSFPKESSKDGICDCTKSTHSLSNGICSRNSVVPELQKFDRKSLFKMEYENGISIESRFLRENILSVFYLCKAGGNESACQILANSCTMQLYTYSKDATACTLYESLDTGIGTGNPDIRESLPKLSFAYEEHFLILQTSNFIPNQFTSNFDDPSSDVNITVAKYTVEGHFLGLVSLTDVIPCQEPMESRRMSQKFGTTTRMKCVIRIQNLWQQRPLQMEFLDTFLSLQTNSTQLLYSIPIKIMNVRRNGVLVNEAIDKYQWQLHRRFFIIDSISGLEAQSTETVPKIIRYVEKIKVGIQLQKQDEAGRIFAPLITVYYNQLTSEDILTNRKVSFTYEVEYYMDLPNTIEAIKISVGVISSLAVIWAAFQTWSWNRRSGRAEIDLETIATLLLTSCGHIADAFFIVCFSTGLYWWIFFKKQIAIHVLLPQPEQERIIRDLLISAFSLKVVDMFKLIGRQVTVDIFFVDWEKPKSYNIISAPTQEKVHDPKSSAGAGGTGRQKEERSVSIWRSYFVANEWNEIQSMRKVHMASQILFALLLLEVFGMKNLGLHWPDCTFMPGPEAKNIPYSTVARFTTCTLVFGSLGILQWLYRIGIYERFISNKVQDFVDICTLANISVFILAAKQYGYYIHGRSVHGFADTDMQTMVEQLNREEEDLCGRRGLVATYDQQTFLISVPKSLRLVYDQVLQPLYVSSNLAGHGRQVAMMPSKGSATITKPSSAQLIMSAHAYHSMNRFLTSFLEHALSDIDYEVNDKSFFEATFDMEFSEAGAGSDRAVFYNDNGHSFDAVLFYGNERTIFFFNLYLFIFVDILSHDFVLAGIVTFLVDMVLKYIRNFFGKRNIARKTLIDGRFLI